MVVDKQFTRAIIETVDNEAPSSFVASNFLMMLFAFATAPHSRLWLEHIPDSDLLNDDNPIVRFYPTGEVIVYGSPWSGKTPCYRNEAVPVGAFVRLKQATQSNSKGKDSTSLCLHLALLLVLPTR